MRLLPCGDRALLVELPDGPTRRAFAAAVHRAQLPDLLDVVAAATTVLVRTTADADLQSLAACLRALDLDVVAAPGGEAGAVVIDVLYDGPDLAGVAATLAVSVEEVVRRHVDQWWTVEFTGFAPGFGYLAGDRGGLDVPRRPSPRTSVPAGSVGLAGPYTGIYPRPSPGGWQLIGTATAVLWDERRDPPALLRPGTRVRFRDLGGAS